MGSVMCRILTRMSVQNYHETKPRCHTLVIVKVLHTVIWCFFVMCIVGIWVAAAQKNFISGTWLTGMVVVECAVLAANRGRCPLAKLAQRYTDDRRANFDIYLPLWLARWNKWIFGAIFGSAEVYLILRYLL